LSPAAGGLRVPRSDRSSHVSLEAKDARLDNVPLYEVTEAGLVARPVTSFADLGLYERHDIQKLLRDAISPWERISGSPDPGVGGLTTSAL
jgi:hypothetical protein